VWKVPLKAVSTHARPQGFLTVVVEEEWMLTNVVRLSASAMLSSVQPRVSIAATLAATPVNNADYFQLILTFSPFKNLKS
jgi:hypothetical protein